MGNHNIISILATIFVIVNDLDPFYRKVWVDIEADNISADSAEGAYHVAQAVTRTIFQAMLFALNNDGSEGVVHTLDVEIEAEASTHDGKLTRTAFPAAAIDPESAAIYAYSREVEIYIDNFMDAMRADVAEMLKSLAAAHFEDTDGGEGESYAVTRRSITPKP